MPFVFKDQLCLSYGLHTTRVYPQEKTTLPAQWEYLNKNGRTGAFKRATTAGVPAGATYAVSADGVANFKKSNIMFHPCENPSVYTDPNGKLRMMANCRFQRHLGIGIGRRRLALHQSGLPARRRLHVLLPLGQVRLHHRRFHGTLVEARRRAELGV